MREQKLQGQNFFTSTSKTGLGIQFIKAMELNLKKVPSTKKYDISNCGTILKIRVSLIYIEFPQGPILTYTYL